MPTPEGFPTEDLENADVPAQPQLEEEGAVVPSEMLEDAEAKVKNLVGSLDQAA